MNIKPHTVIHDVTGKTGLAIVEAIIKGESDPHKFLQFVNNNIKANDQMIVNSLQGNWRSELLYLLEDCHKCYLYYCDRIATCDQAIEKQLNTYQKDVLPESIIDTSTNSAKQATKNTPKFNTCSYLKGILGVDVTTIFGLSDISALEILTETGTDMKKWETSKHFVSWLNLCPNNKISCGKLVSSMVMKKKPNIASQAFRNTANGVQKSDKLAWRLFYKNEV